MNAKWRNIGGYTVGVLFAVSVIAAFNLFPMDAQLANFMVDKPMDGNGANYFSVQSFMWVVLFLCLASLLLHYLDWYHLRGELKTLHIVSLHRDEHISPSAVNLLAARLDQRLYLSRLVRVLAQYLEEVEATRRYLPSFYQANEREMSNVASVFNGNSSMINQEAESIQYEIEISYNLIRYYAWFLPTLGFAGTVAGVLKALHTAASIPPSSEIFLPSVIAGLGTAFSTTLLGLIFTAIVLLLLNIAYNAEERLLIRCVRQIHALAHLNRTHIEL